MAQALQAVQMYAGTVTAVVTVSDDGGSSGRLAPALDIPPPGDIRRCMLALTPEDSPWRELFDYRFEAGDVHGHSLGNLLLAAFADIEGSFDVAVRRAESWLGTVGAVVPVAPAHLRLAAEVAGHVIHGQAKIGRARGRIDRLWVEPTDVRASARALERIAAADQIVLGPGSLYTSLIATLVVPGVAAAVNESGARLVYVANLITQDGETLGMDLSAHIKALMDLAGVRKPSAIVAESETVDVASPLEPVRADPDELAAQGMPVMLVTMADPAATWPQHDPALLGKALAELVT